ncbi:MAG: hypothetical protein IIX14_05535 [Clostridia bacterium]|nr:hypothetical protein [Clostridia bacterium]
MANEEIEISELEFTEELAGDNLIPVESTTDTKATSLQILKNWLSGFFVGKTGNETIQGVKTFTSAPCAIASQPSYYLQMSGYDNATTPTELKAGAMSIIDQKGNIAGRMGFWITTDGSKSMRFITFDGKGNNTQLMVGFKSDGSVFTMCPASDVSSSIVTTVSKSKTGNGYYKLGNGLIIQWGTVPNTSANGTVTYPTPFSSLSRVATSITDSGTTEPRVIRIYDTSTTNFKYSCYKQNASSATNTATSFMWLAVGY